MRMTVLLLLRVLSRRPFDDTEHSADPCMRVAKLGLCQRWSQEDDIVQAHGDVLDVAQSRFCAEQGEVEL